MLKTTRAAIAFLWTAALLMPLATQAARPLGPPVAELVSGYNKVMVARAVERIDAGRVRFECLKPYFGDPAESIILRTGEADASFVEVGQRYVVAYTLVTNDSQFREVKFEDPEGPKIVGIRGVDDQAVFEDTAELRFLFDQAVAEEPAPPRKVLDALLVQMQRDDNRARSLVVLEIVLRPDLVEIVDSKDGRVVRDVIGSETVPIQSKDFLLRTAARFPAAARAEWLVAAQRSIVKTAPIELELISPMPSYVRTAALGLQVTGDASDVPVLRRLLGSNAPGVAKAALNTMDSLDPAATLVVARAAVNDQSLLAETRRELDLYLQRNDDTDLFSDS